MSTAIGGGNFFIPPDHLEQFSRALSELIIGPYQKVFYYACPTIGAFFSNAQYLCSDAALQGMMPIKDTPAILKEIEDLTRCAGIQRKIIPYAGLNYHFSSYGGACSITDPVLFIPYQQLFRPDNPHFGPQDIQQNSIWVFSNDETRFLIARELGQIKENNALLRIAIKVAVIAALVLIYTSPFGWQAGLALMIGVLGLYIVSERVFQGRADLDAIEILQKSGMANPKQIAKDTLEKMVKQNLHHQQHSKLASLYISHDGNNLLDLVSPSLTTRLKAIE